METADVKAPVTESSTATKPVQFNAWDEHGTPIVKPSKEDSAPSQKSSAAVDDDDAEKGAPASEAGKKTTQEPRRDNAETRKAQLNAEIRELLAKRDALKAEVDGGTKKSDVKAEPSPAAPKTEPELKSPEKPKRPKLADFGNDYDKYNAALEKYEDEDMPAYYDKLTDYKAEVKLREERARQQRDAQQKDIQKQFDEAAEVYPDFKEKSAPVIKTLTEDQQIHPAFKQAVGESPVFAHLLYALTGEQAQKLLDLARKDVVAAVKKLGVLENAVMDELGKRKAGTKADDGGEKKPEKAPEKREPKAPKPPSEVGGRGTTPEDERVSAAKANDFSAFEKAENARRFRNA